MMMTYGIIDDGVRLMDYFCHGSDSWDAHEKGWI